MKIFSESSSPASLLTIPFLLSRPYYRRSVKIPNGKSSKYLAKNVRGFTLIELLVVVAIIAVLISILVPSLGEARDHAKTILCMSNLKSMGLGIGVYLTDYNGKFISTPPDWVWYDDPDIRKWQAVLTPYLGGPENHSDRPDTVEDLGVLHCPVTWVKNPTDQSIETGFMQFYGYGGSYGINNYLYVLDPSNPEYIPLENLKHPADTAMICDFFYYYWFDSQVITLWRNLAEPWKDGPHGDNLNVLWADLHVAPYDTIGCDIYEYQKDFWGDTWGLFY
jgi:prepilin-type N-terminal cleavage/methylation domain-containing protein/prepilin-type processing-associated H-X9-DG protein